MKQYFIARRMAKKIPQAIMTAIRSGYKTTVEIARKAGCEVNIAEQHIAYLQKMGMIMSVRIPGSKILERYVTDEFVALEEKARISGGWKYVADALALVAKPTASMRVYDYISENPDCTVGEIYKALEMEQSATSYILISLREKGYLNHTKDGKRVLNRITGKVEKVIEAMK